MGMVVRSNMMAMNANRQLGMNSSSVQKSLEKLSSGFKINRAGDDASGLAISEKMKAQIKGLETASANAQDGISLIQTAEGALTEVHSMLNRMVELAGKSSNGTIQNEVDRDNIQNEVNALVKEIDRIGDSTNFNGINLIDGNLAASGSTGGASDVVFKGNAALSNSTPSAANYTAKSLTATTGSAAGDKWSFSVGLDNGKNQTFNFTFAADSAGKITKLIAEDGTEYSVTEGAATATELAKSVVGEVNKKMGDTFTASNTLGAVKLTANENGTGTPKVTSFGESSKGVGKDQAVTTVEGTDKFKQLKAADLTMFDGTNAKDAVFTVNGKKFAMVSSAATADTIAKLDKDVTYVKATGTTMAAADGAKLVETINQKTGLTLTQKLGTIDLKDAGSVSTATGGLVLQVGDTSDNFNKVTVSVDNMKSNGLGVAGLDVSTQDSAAASVQTIRDAINKVSTNRGSLGALQNRLEHTINNLDVSAENMTAANSRIRDTDMAKEMMEYTKINVLTQAAQAMLAQANQQPQSILQLLQ